MVSETSLGQRRHDRVRVDLYVNEVVGDQVHMARTRDLSEDGASLYRLLAPNIPEGTRLGLELRLPNSDEVIWATADVIRDVVDGGQDKDAGGREGAGQANEYLALSFAAISREDRERIRRFVASALGDAL